MKLACGLSGDQFLFLFQVFLKIIWIVHLSDGVSFSSQLELSNMSDFLYVYTKFFCLSNLPMIERWVKIPHYEGECQFS